MKTSIKGHLLPESAADFTELIRTGQAHKTACRMCGSEFGSGNCYSPQGWRETQISGTCEKCFDALFPPEGLVP